MSVSLDFDPSVSAKAMLQEGFGPNFNAVMHEVIALANKGDRAKAGQLYLASSAIVSPLQVEAAAALKDKMPQIKESRKNKAGLVMLNAMAVADTLKSKVENAHIPLLKTWGIISPKAQEGKKSS